MFLADSVNFNIEVLALRERKSKSVVIREALDMYIRQKNLDPTRTGELEVLYGR
ncbi:MAG: ribbon-helix-helix protein, CopG family [Acidobacteria bacterium]|nr:ribbon-helix-helix protein, CopG family [Acidobacteriota bacterium]